MVDLGPEERAREQEAAHLEPPEVEDEAVPVRVISLARVGVLEQVRAIEEAEPVRVGGEILGRVTTGGYGYTVERSIAYAYLPPEHAEPGTAVELEIFGQWIGGEVADEPLFDPRSERVRGSR